MKKGQGHYITQYITYTISAVLTYYKLDKVSYIMIPQLLV